MVRPVLRYCLLCAAMCCALFLPQAAGAADGGAAPTSDVDAGLHEHYLGHLAANDSAAERWRAAHPGGVTGDLPDDDQLVADNHGCPEGTQFWQRDRITELCAPLCSGDQDCGPEDGRCRILDTADTADEAPMVLVDDVPPDEVDDWMAGTDPRSPPVMVCDPFWDVDGASDADLLVIGPTGAG